MKGEGDEGARAAGYPELLISRLGAESESGARVRGPKSERAGSPLDQHQNSKFVSEIGRASCRERV